MQKNIFFLYKINISFTTLESYFIVKLSVMRRYHRKIVSLFLSESSVPPPNSVVTASRLFVGGQEAAVETRACLRNGVTVPSPRRVGYIRGSLHVAVALRVPRNPGVYLESNSVLGNSINQPAVQTV